MQLGWWCRRAGLAGLFLAVPALAVAPPWWDGAQVRVKVHEHAFHRVTLNGAGCAVRVRLYFDAPAAAYAESASERNHYRFQANVLLSDGTRFSTAVFDNAEPGARVYAASHDTTSQGCWAEHPHSLRKVDVHACRGPRCVPQPFE
jgi:hypothetical protein